LLTDFTTCEKRDIMIALIIYAPVIVILIVDTIKYYWEESERRDRT
jgi:hypothetical protein